MRVRKTAVFQAAVADARLCDGQPFGPQSQRALREHRGFREPACLILVTPSPFGEARTLRPTTCWNPLLVPRARRTRVAGITSPTVPRQ